MNDREPAASSDKVSLLRRYAQTLSLSREELRLVALMLAIKLVVFIFAVESFRVTQNQPVGGWSGALAIWNRWDSLHYLKLAEFGYSASGEMRASMVFYPFFPMIVQSFALVFRNYLISGLLVSTLASILAGLSLKRLTQLDHSAEVAQRAVWFLFIFPTSYFLHIAYSEALFIMLTVLAVLRARQERWHLAGLFGFCAAMTRTPGILLIPTLMIEAWLQYRTTRRWQWQWLWAFLPALGLFNFLLLNERLSGNLFEFAAIQQSNYRVSLTTPWAGIWSMIGVTGTAPGNAEIVGVQALIFTLLGLLCTIISWIKLRPTYALWMTLNWLMYSSMSFSSSLPRYTMVMFPIYLLFARAAERRVAGALLSFWSVMYLALFVSLFVRGWWAF